MGSLAASARRAGAVLVTGLLALVLGGCGLFQLTAPVPPQGGGTVVIGDYSTPEKCIYYMALGLTRKDDVGRDLYVGALADSFYATFDPVVLNAVQGVKPDVWDYELESRFYSTLIALYTETYEFTWGPDEQNPHDDYDTKGDSWKILHRHYRLRTCGERDTLIKAIGYADLTFRYVAPRWVLTRWQDRLDPAIGYDPLERTMGGIRLEPK